MKSDEWVAYLRTSSRTSPDWRLRIVGEIWRSLARQGAYGIDAARSPWSE